jgi:hypothetical protein
VQISRSLATSFPQRAATAEEARNEMAAIKARADEIEQERRAQAANYREMWS